MGEKRQALTRRTFLKLIGTAATITQFPQLVHGATSEKLAKNQILKYQLGELKDLLPVDPAFCTGDSRGVTVAVYNPLVELVPGTINQFIPCLAERWEVAKDGTTWTFYLRKGIQFHQNFGELTSEDVKFTFDRLKEVKARWQRPNFRNIDAVDKYTVRIATAVPDAFFLYTVTNFNGGEIVSKKAVQSIGDKEFRLKPIGGTGPFVFESYTPAKGITLVRNPHFFRGKPILDKIEFIFIPDLNSRLLALKNGNVDIITGIDEQQWIDARVKEGFKASGRWGGCYMLHFNMTRKPFDSLKVRQAIAYAIDRDQLSEFFGGGMKPLLGFISPAVEGSLKKEEIPKKYLYSYDPDQAKKLLAEAGFSGGFEVQMVGHPRKTYANIIEMIQAQLKIIGINLNITASDEALYYDTIFKDKNPLAIWAPLMITPDTMMTEYWHSSAIVTKPTGSLNFSHYGDLTGNIDKIIEAARQTFDLKKRNELYLQAQIKLWEDLPTFPLLYSATGKYILRPYVDLGYKYIDNPDAAFQINEQTRVLEH